MALPTSFNTISVEASYVDFTGTAGTGTVLFEPMLDGFLLEDAINVFVVPKAITASLNPQGDLSVTLPLTDDPDMTPPYYYRVTEQISGTKRTYNIQLLTSMLPGPVNLADISPVGTVPEGSTILTLELANTLYAPIGTGGGGGGTGEDGRTPELSVDATNILWKYTDEVTWQILLPLSEIQGEDGADAPAPLILDTAEAVPVGTPANTVIYRRDV